MKRGHLHLTHQYLNPSPGLEEESDTVRVSTAGSSVQRSFTEQNHAVRFSSIVQQKINIFYSIDSDRGQQCRDTEFMKTMIDISSSIEKQRQNTRVLNGSRTKERSSSAWDIENIERDLRKIDEYEFIILQTVNISQVSIQLVCGKVRGSQWSYFRMSKYLLSK